MAEEDSSSSMRKRKGEEVDMSGNDDDLYDAAAATFADTERTGEEEKEEEGPCGSTTASMPSTSTTPAGIYWKLKDLDEKLKDTDEKLKDLDEKIKNLQGEVATKEKEIKELPQEVASKSSMVAIKDAKMKYLEQLLQVQNQRSELQNQRSELQNQRWTLETCFTKGEYYAATSEYWKKGVYKVPVKKGDHFNISKWQEFARTPSDVEGSEFKCRAYDSTGKAKTNDPYTLTKEGATSKTYVLVGSETTKTDTSTQSVKAQRDQVWPTDIFGNRECNQQIAHLLPSGRQDHKEWIKVAAAVIGIDVDSHVDILSKATRGFKQCPSDKKNTSKQDPKNTGSSPRKAGLGVVHFVSNKIRLANQFSLIDGSKPSAFLVPVMTLREAKNWRGNGYDAVFLLGYPAGDTEIDVSQVPSLTHDAGLNKPALLTKDAPRDATSTEIDCAQKLLVDAFLALRAMVANFDDVFIKSVFPKASEISEHQKRQKLLEDVYKQARKEDCCIPVAVTGNEGIRKPVCLLTFGGEGKHPPPDPLLLVLKAANIWGIMTGQRLLANGDPYDPHADMSEGDFIAESAYYEASFGHWKPDSTTWEELAAGLGQPHGYCP